MSSDYIMYRTRLSTFALSGPFVYRLGRKIFILERGVRFSYGLPRPSNLGSLFLFGIDYFVLFFRLDV